MEGTAWYGSKGEMLQGINNGILMVAREGRLDPAHALTQLDRVICETSYYPNTLPITYPPPLNSGAGDLRVG